MDSPVVRALLALLAAGALLLLVRRRVGVLRSQREELESVVAERTSALLERERELARKNALLEAQAAQLQALDIAKTRFFANVSHELRTPLTLTIGPLEDLQARGGRDSQEERWIDIALRNSRRLLRLVNQILDVAKLEAGQMQLQPRPLDLSTYVRGLVSAFGSVAERKRIALSLETPPSLKGLFDADAIEKILTNLLSNAVKFTPDGGAVRVLVEQSTKGETPAVSMRVIDTGPGIPKAQLEHVFERFYQVDESDARLQAGTGIGLALVKELVELHGGAITAESDPRGTMFTVLIPFGEVAQAASLSPSGTLITGATKIPLRPTLDTPVGSRGGDLLDQSDVPAMLVVDDSDDLRAYIRDHFRKEFRVVEARDGAEGIEAARRELPDVVVSDVMMPGTDGFTLVRTLRESPETDYLAIVLLTAQAEDEKKLTGLQSGADEYLVKPFDMRELDVRVRNLIAARRRLRDRFVVEGVRMGEVGVNAAPAAVEAGTSDGNGGELEGPHAGSDAESDAGHTEPDAPSRAPLSPSDQQFRDRVHRVIMEAMSNPEFGVAELADAVAQDRSHLFRRVKQVFGTSPSNLLRQCRLDAGARLLLEERGTVADVAYAVGFNSVSYFCQCFQQQFGDTPASYRSRQGAVPR